jgi:hypothetical protein
MNHVRLPPTATLLLACVLESCGSEATAPGGSAAFRIEVSGESFVIEVTNDARVAEFESRLSAGVEGVVIGPLLDGDGGFNQPWTWHLDPTEVQTADAAIELCDGRPSMVEADLEYWIDTVGTFCPWGATVTERLR